MENSNNDYKKLEMISEESEVPLGKNISERSEIFYNKFFPGTDIKDWTSWHWQLSNSITTLDRLKDFLNLKRVELQVDKLNKDSLPLRITPYYLYLVKQSDIIRKTVVPTIEETIISDYEESDSLKENEYSKTDCIVHRYPDRVLFLATDFCSTYCRYCTRSHNVSKNNNTLNKNNWQEGINYIKEHKEIRDVLISGGDPLTISNYKLEQLISAIREIEHVEIIRLGTKVPVVMPQRITYDNKLVNMLKRYGPIYMNIHFTHPDEITQEVKDACNMLADNGIVLGSQTVLLKDINDDSDIIKKLMQELLKIRVKPYYLYQCDPILGSSHFRTKVEKGLDIIDELTGNTSGMVIPKFIVDTKGGKINYTSNLLIEQKNDNLFLKNFEGKLIKYPNKY
jgi:lysine 2,3-aminomutase